MMQEQSSNQAGSARTRRRILEAAIRLYREIGHRKTTVADIACRSAMSPANIYRFFRSKQEIEEVVVAELLDEVVEMAAKAARGGSPIVYRLKAVLRTISELHERRLTNDNRLQQLVVAASDANWPIALAYVGRIVGLLAQMIAAGQARGEFREERAATLACCLLTAMNAHVRVREVSAAAVQPTFDEMIEFCINALCLPVSGQGVQTHRVEQSRSYGGNAKPS